jgi:predicted PurR-regulated permease PerM
MIGKYSLINMLKEAHENKHMIQAYLQNKSMEGYEDVNISNNDKKLFGFGVGAFLLLLVVGLVLWIWALVVTIKYWDQLPTWAKVLAILGLFTGFGGPVLTLIVVYVSKGSGDVSGGSSDTSRVGFRFY